MPASFPRSYHQMMSTTMYSSLCTPRALAFRRYTLDLRGPSMVLMCSFQTFGRARRCRLASRPRAPRANRSRWAACCRASPCPSLGADTLLYSHCRARRQRIQSQRARLTTELGRNATRARSQCRQRLGSCTLRAQTLEFPPDLAQSRYNSFLRR